MPVIIPDLGEVEMLRWTLWPDGTRPTHLSVMLFKSEGPIHRSSVIGDFEEADFAGYSRFDIAWDGWTNPAIVGQSAVSIWATEPVVFTCSAGAQTVYGYLVVPPDGSVAIWGEVFEEPIDVTPSNGVRFAPFMRAHSEIEPVPPPPP